MEHTVYLSIGSNIGDAELNCDTSVDMLRCADNLEVTAVSGYYKTEPVDYLDQNYFVNLAVRLKTDLSPYDLLRKLKQIQELMGQGKKEVRFGPRIIDLDIIFYNHMILDTSDLELPHPRMQNRMFVLKPLCDIAPGYQHPVFNLSVQEMLDRISSKNQECCQIK